MRNIFFAYIHSNINYLLSAYANAPKYLLNKLEILRKKAIKYIYNLNRDFPTSTLFRDNIYSLDKLIKIDMVTLMYKIKNDLIKYNSSMYTRGEISQRVTRSQDNFNIQ
jgi:hypothetical protein